MRNAPEFIQMMLESDIRHAAEMKAKFLASFENDPCYALGWASEYHEAFYTGVIAEGIENEKAASIADGTYTDEGLAYLVAIGKAEERMRNRLLRNTDTCHSSSMFSNACAAGRQRADAIMLPKLESMVKHLS